MGCAAERLYRRNLNGGPHQRTELHHNQWQSQSIVFDERVNLQTWLYHKRLWPSPFVCSGPSPSGWPVHSIAISLLLRDENNIINVVVLVALTLRWNDDCSRPSLHVQQSDLVML